MKLDTLGQILAAERHVRRDGSVYTIDEPAQATVFVGAAGELLTIGRIIRIELGKECCSFVTAKNEHYYVPSELVLALKFEQMKETRTTAGSAGFR